MKPQLGEVITGDFQENTITIEIEGTMELSAGKVAIIPLELYNQFIKPRFCEHVPKNPKRKESFCTKCGIIVINRP